MGCPRGDYRGRWPYTALHWSSILSWSNKPASLCRIARAWNRGVAPGKGVLYARPQYADSRSGQADWRSYLQDTGGYSDAECQGFRPDTLRHDASEEWYYPCGRPGTRSDTAGNDHCLRWLSYFYSRRHGGDCFRYRNEWSGNGTGFAMYPSVKTENDAYHCGRWTGQRGDCKRRGSVYDVQDDYQWRYRILCRICGFGDSQHDNGRTSYAL